MQGHKTLYGFSCPIGTANDSKLGISGHEAVRLGVYQNSYSRKSHVACFNIAYTGPARVIERLERALKQEYNWQIARDGRGVSEWVSDTSPADLERMIDTLVNGHNFKVTKVPKKYLPITVDNLDEYLKYVEELP